MKAVIILFDGNTPSDSTVAELIATIRSAQRNGDVPATVTVLDDTTVAKALVSAKTGATVKSVIIPPAVIEETPQDKALIFIGERYKSFIGLNMNSFERKLTQDYLIAKYKISTNHASKEDLALVNALKVLSEHEYNVSQALMKKYNFQKKTLETIINTYNSYNQ